MDGVLLSLAVVHDLAAEVAARLRAADLVPVRYLGGARRELAVLAVPQFDQEPGLRGARVGEPAHRAVRRRSELRRDRVRLVGLRRVVAGLRDLTAVGE